MKVWIVNPFDNLPMEGTRAQRYWLMARALVRRGHEVTYHTADFSHARKRARVFATENPDRQIKLELVHEPGYRKNLGPARVYAHWRLARAWRALAFAAAETPDLVIVSSPPLLLSGAVRRFCRRRGVKMIVDVQDAWPETFYRVLPKWALWPLKRLARRNYLAAAAISAVSRRYLDLVRTYDATCPMHLCYHGIELPAAVRSAADDPAVPFRLVYLGNMSLSYDLATLIDAVKRLPQVTLELAGTGPDEPALRERAKACARIRFHGYLDEESLFKVLRGAHAGMIAMFPASLVGIPGKMADYLAFGLPIVNSLDGEALELLDKSGAGIHYEAGCVESLICAIKKYARLRQNSPKAWQECAHAARALAANFDAERIYDKYCDFAEKIVSLER